ncbi:exonuclease SbcCD subunit D [Enterococcus sp. BWM-S5]|uniref:Nuclease SbcCD subunit D n=1 Tax=Enterococcus larvae TaxID=2794352 RepID=A0ABS4CM98_9ENTE|nr:exonuclease SbcCD subunit D [Enterococcus larvae]MBP1047718.1 exonuclease SbcCD subunit D [Enterococcus larvae]
MRFLHTADWHIGKKLHGYNLLEDQLHAFNQIIQLAKKEAVDGIIIAGDLYDRSVPSVDAVEVFNQMIIELNLEEKLPVFAISGNHDSSIRLETGGPWFKQSDFYLHTRLEQAFQPIEVGDTQLFLLPYFEPIAARLYFENDEIRTIEKAMEFVTAEIKKNFKSGMAHVLVSHFFAAGSAKSDSETKLTVGGLDTVPLDLLRDFDYVALGHLHNKDALISDQIRYSGSPLKFSLSERKQEKGVWIVDISEQSCQLEFHRIQPLREIKELQGTFQELAKQEFYESIDRKDFMFIQLTDRSVIPNMMYQLRKVYPNILGVERVYGRENDQKGLTKDVNMKQLSPLELSRQFFEEMTEEELTSQQEQWLNESLDSVQQKERGK